MSIAATIYPSLSYDDPLAAIEWLCASFGFRLRLLVRDEEDGVRHSELSLGPGVIMVSSARPEEGRQSPCHLGGVTQALSLFVEDPDAHFARAEQEGAEIVQPLQNEAFGARGYMAKDPEGHLWCFSDYRPGEYWDQEF